MCGVERFQNQKLFFLLAHIRDAAQKSGRTENLDTFYHFHTTLLYIERGRHDLPIKSIP